MADQYGNLLIEKQQENLLQEDKKNEENLIEQQKQKEELDRRIEEDRITNIDQINEEILKSKETQQINQPGSFSDVPVFNKLISKKEAKAIEKARKQEEKKAAQKRYKDAIGFEKRYTDSRSDDSPAMAAIREALRVYYTEEEEGKVNRESEDEEVRNNAYVQLGNKLDDIVTKCNKYLRFKVCFSKAARERTNKVRELRQEAINKRETEIKVDSESLFIKDAVANKDKKSEGGVKGFFKERIPAGFKALGRTIAKPFVNTFAHRSAGQVAKEFLRDHIWGGIFRNTFNIVAMAALLPFWAGGGLVRGCASILNKTVGTNINLNKIHVVHLPTPHLPSTWTRYHQEMARDREMQKLRSSEGPDNVAQEGDRDYLINNQFDGKHYVSPAQSPFFRLFGWAPTIDKKGTSEFSYENMTKEEIKNAKAGKKYSNKLIRYFGVEERARQEYLTTIKEYEEGNYSDDEDDE